MSTSAKSPPTPRMTPQRLQALKGVRKIAMVTVHDFPTARFADEAGIPLLLVGDSLGMTVLGYDTTLPVTMEEMLHHTRASARGTRQAMVIGDMPFLSYQPSVETALANAGRFIKEGGADAVKLEGGAFRAETVRALVDNGIPVMGHVGLLPQNVKAMGGYAVQGRTPAGADDIVRDALALQAAGAFSLVVEGVPADLAARITREVSVPVIGIGAGPDCDGQVLVSYDLLGMYGSPPSFARVYAHLGEAMRTAFATYRAEVESGAFPPRS